MNSQSEWKEVEVSEVAEVRSGSGFPTKHQGRAEGDYPFYKVSDMNLTGNERWMRNHNNAISTETKNLMRARTHPAGTVIFPKIGAAIATNKKRILTCESCFDNNVAGIRPGPELDTQFLYHYLLTTDLSEFASSSNPPSIRKSALEVAKIPLPPLPEQKRIAAILDTADALRAKRRESLEQVDNLVRSVFLNMFGDPLTNPKGLPVRPLGDVATLQRGFDLPVKKRMPGLVPVHAANGPVGFHNQVKVAGPGVVTGRSGTLGTVRFVPEDFWPLNTALWVKDFHGNNPRWVAKLLELFRLERFSRGAGVPTLNRNLVHVENVPVPQPEQQARFAHFWESQEEQRVRLESHLAELDTLFASLQSRAFRGEL